MKRGSVLMGAWLASLSLLTAAGAAAQTEPEPSSAAAPPAAEGEPVSPDVAEARSAFQEGIALAKIERWAPALQALQRSDALRPHAVTQYNIGYCELKLGRLTRARKALTKALAEHQTRGGVELPAEQASAARTYLSEIDQRLARVIVTTTPGTVAVDGSPLEPAEGTSARPVLLAGTRDAGPPEVPPSATFEVLLDPGTHRFVLVRDGQADISASQTLAAGSQTSLSLHAPEPLPAKASTARPAPRALPSEKPSRTLAFSALAVGVAGVTVGSVSGLIALGRKGQVRDACHGPDADQALCISERNSGYRAADISTAAFLVGGASLATSALLLWVFPGKKPSKSATAKPQVHAVLGAGALGLQGRF